jgi:hypothetical protein
MPDGEDEVMETLPASQPDFSKVKKLDWVLKPRMKAMPPAYHPTPQEVMEQAPAKQLVMAWCPYHERTHEMPRWTTKINDFGVLEHVPRPTFTRIGIYGCGMAPDPEIDE